MFTFIKHWNYNIYEMYNRKCINACLYSKRPSPSLSSSANKCMDQNTRTPRCSGRPTTIIQLLISIIVSGIGITPNKLSLKKHVYPSLLHWINRLDSFEIATGNEMKPLYLYLQLQLYQSNPTQSNPISKLTNYQLPSIRSISSKRRS